MVWLLASGYRAIHWQILLVVVALPLVGYHRKVAKFLCAFLLALIVTICISAAVPAIGVYGVLDLTPLDFPNIVETGYPGGYADISHLSSGDGYKGKTRQPGCAVVARRQLTRAEFL